MIIATRLVGYLIYHLISTRTRGINVKNTELLPWTSTSLPLYNANVHVSPASEFKVKGNLFTPQVRFTPAWLKADETKSSTNKTVSFTDYGIRPLLMCYTVL